MSRKPRAGQIRTITANFDHILSGSDDDAQKAFDTLDDHIHAETRGGTGQTTYNRGDILYSDASNSLDKRAIGADGYVLTSRSGVPVWEPIPGAAAGDVIDVITAGKIDGLTAGVTRYLLPNFSEVNDESFPAYLIDGYGDLSNLVIYLGTAPGVGEQVAFTVRLNGVATTLLDTIVGTTNVGGNVVNTVSVSHGDRITIEAVSSGGSVAADIQMSIRFTESPEITTEDVIDIVTVGKIGIIATNPLSYTTRYLLPNFAESSNEVFPAYLVEEDGYMDNLLVYADGYPDGYAGAGDTVEIAVRVNGAPTTLSATLIGTAHSVQNMIDSFNVNRGDRITVRSTSSPGSAASNLYAVFRYNR